MNTGTSNFGPELLFSNRKSERIVGANLRNRIDFIGGEKMRISPREKAVCVYVCVRE